MNNTKPPEKIEIPLELFDAMVAGLDALDDLRNESRGVSGLHLNGDVAPWEDLGAAGEFSSWLGPTDQALEALTKWRGSAIGAEVRAQVIRRQRELAASAPAQNYRVTWEIDVDAISALDAARQALAIQRRPSAATCFQVRQRLHPDGGLGAIEDFDLDGES